MFGKPMRRPPNSNVLPLIWTYLIKTDGTKKASCVCNGSPSRRGSVTLAHTYAAALDQIGARNFWAINLHNTPTLPTPLPKHYLPKPHFMSPSMRHSNQGTQTLPYHCWPRPPCTPRPPRLPRIPTPMGLHDPRHPRRTFPQLHQRIQ